MERRDGVEAERAPRREDATGVGDRVRVGATESSLLGPFYREGAPVREMGFDISLGDSTGDPAYIHGKVVDADYTETR